MIVVTVARRPLSEGSIAANVLKHGCGAINIDASRIRSVAGETIGPGSWSDPSKRSGEVGGDMGFTGNDVTAFQRAQAESVERANRMGRWPANLVLAHLEGCQQVGIREVSGDGHWPSSRPRGSDMSGPSGHKGQVGLDERHASGEQVPVWECVEGCPVAELDDQTGIRRSTLTGARDPKSSVTSAPSKFRPNQGDGAMPQGQLYGDTGGASRFFKQVGGQGK